MQSVYSKVKQIVTCKKKFQKPKHDQDKSGFFSFACKKKKGFYIVHII